MPTPPLCHTHPYAHWGNFPCARNIHQIKIPDRSTFLRWINLHFLNKDTPLVDSNLAPTSYHGDSVGMTDDTNNNDVPNNTHTENDDTANSTLEFSKAIEFDENEDTTFDDAVENHPDNIVWVAPEQKNTASDDAVPIDESDDTLSTTSDDISDTSLNNTGVGNDTPSLP